MQESVISNSNNSMGLYWLTLGGTGSVWSGYGWYLVVLGQWKAVLVDMYMMVLGQYTAVQVGTWWYWVSGRRY